MPPPGPWLQHGRLAMYVALPVAATVLYTNSDVMERIITSLNYVIYPAAGPPPPSADEMEKLMAARRAEKKR